MLTSMKKFQYFDYFFYIINAPLHRGLGEHFDHLPGTENTATKMLPSKSVCVGPVTISNVSDSLN